MTVSMVTKKLLMNKRQTLYICLLCFIFIEKCRSKAVMSIHRRFHGDAFVLRENEDSIKIIDMDSTSGNCNCTTGSFLVSTSLSECNCQCNRTSAIFREDLMACVQEINECPSDSFEMIPQAHFHQKTHFISTQDAIPNLDLNRPHDEGVSLFCIIVKGQYLTKQGWKEMEGTAFDLPLRLRSEHGNLSFEWVGNSSSKEEIEGRLILIHLLCKNAASSISTSFQQCVPLRVEGIRNLTETIYLLQEETDNENSLTKGILIAIGLLLASLTISYILISFFYFRVKRKRIKKRNDVFKRLPELERGNLGMSNNYFKNQNIQNDFKPETPRKKSAAPSPPVANNNEEKVPNTSRANEIDEEDDEIYSTASYEEELEGRRQRYERIKKEMEAMQLRQCEEEKELDDYDHYEATASSLGLAIVETSGSTENVNQCKVESQLEDKPVVGMRPRKRLFFNPSYFDPEMLQTPPPAAMEFLSNVRHMMAVAKQKIQMKSFQPTLIDIPEDYGSIKEKSNFSTLNPKELSNLESKKEFNFNDKINEMASYSNHKEINKTFLNQSTDDKIIKNVVDNLLKIKDNDQNIVNGMVRNFEMNNKTNNVILKVDDAPYPVNKTNALRLKVQMMQKSPKINNEIRTNRPEFKSTSIKRHRSLRENTQAFRNSVEAIKQEIQSKLTRVSSLSRVQSLKKNKKESLEKSLDSDQHVETRKNKVQRWLHSIECGNTEIPANFFVNSNIKDKLLANDPNMSTKESNCHKKATITSINFKGLGKENLSLPTGYTQSDDQNPYQQDTEIYTIDINTHFLAKDEFCNTSNFTEGNSTGDSEYLLPKTVNIQNSLKGDAPIFLNSAKHLNDDDNIIDNSLNPLEEHSYEEIQYNVDPVNNEQEDHYYQSSAFDDDSIKYERINENPRQDSVSECVNSGIQIPGDDAIHKPKANNFLCIELSDTLAGENNKNQYSLEKDSKNRKPVKRNDSMVQDSLERPKVKKKPAADKSEKDYTDLFSLRGLKAFSLNDENTNSDNNTYKTDKPLAAVRRSKTMKTFKDYKKIRFCSSKFSENKLTFFGEGINLNYKSGKSTNSKATTECPPPLPPKHMKSLPENSNEIETLYPLHSTNISLGSQNRPRVRYSNSFTPNDFSRRPKQIFHIYGDAKDTSNNNYCLRKKQDKNSDDDALHTDTISNTYDPLEYPQTSINENNGNCINGLANQKTRHYSEFNLTKNNPNFSNIKSLSLHDIEENNNGNNSEALLNFEDENTRDELERYLTNKKDVTNVKQNWKNFLNKIEDIQEQNEGNFRDHLNLFQNNSNQSDSSYKINASRNLINNEPAKTHLKKSNSISLQNFVKKSSASLVHRSVSLHRMAQGGHGNNKLSLPDTENPKFSVYVNDSFDIED